MDFFVLEPNTMMALLGYAMGLSVISAVATLFTPGINNKSTKAAITTVFCVVAIFTSVVMASGPNGEARTTIEDGTYEVKSVVSYADGPAELGPVGGHYDLLLVEEDGNTHLYRFSARVVELRDSAKREATVVSEQGLRPMIVLFPMEEISG